MIEPNSQTSRLPDIEAGRKPDEKVLLRWRRRNAYYYGWLDRIYKSVVRPGSKVLHVGCECGDLLAAVEPAYGVGVDDDPDAIAMAQ